MNYNRKYNLSCMFLTLITRVISLMLSTIRKYDINSVLRNTNTYYFYGNLVNIPNRYISLHKRSKDLYKDKSLLNIIIFISSLVLYLNTFFISLIEVMYYLDGKGKSIGCISPFDKIMFSTNNPTSLLLNGFIEVISNSLTFTCSSVKSIMKCTKSNNLDKSFIITNTFLNCTLLILRILNTLENSKKIKLVPDISITKVLTVVFTFISIIVDIIYNNISPSLELHNTVLEKTFTSSKIKS